MRSHHAIKVIKSLVMGMESFMGMDWGESNTMSSNLGMSNTPLEKRGNSRCNSN